MHVASSILKATNTSPKCLIRITFPLQQWLHKLTSMLCFTYIACLFGSIIPINFTLEILHFYLRFTLLPSCCKLVKGSNPWFFKEIYHVLISAFDCLQNVSCNDVPPLRDRLQMVSYILFSKIPVACFKLFA